MTATAKRTPTPWAATAATVRREIRARRADLGLPDGVTVKVTSDSFSGGASVDVSLSGDAAQAWAWTGQPGERVLTDAARAAGDAICEIIGAARGDAGYIWGSADVAGACIGSLARQGFVPGQD